MSVRARRPSVPARIATVIVAGARRARATLAPPDAACVKCGAALGRARACTRCGLSRERAAAWVAAQTPPVPELTAAWKATLAAWDEPAAHDRLAELATVNAALPWLARRYRDVDQERRGDPIARARLARMATVMMVTLQSTETTMRSTASRRHYGVLVLAAMVVLLAVATFSARRSSAGQPRKRPAEAFRADPSRVYRAGLGREELPPPPDPGRRALQPRPPPYDR